MVNIVQLTQQLLAAKSELAAIQWGDVVKIVQLTQQLAAAKSELAAIKESVTETKVLIFRVTNKCN